MKPTSSSAHCFRAFSLVEMLAVIAIISVMTALLVPALSQNNSAGRRGAVNTVMNTLEQARVAALEGGRTVYVLFWQRTAPEQDAIMVLRETESGTGNYDQLTKWIKLPKNMLLHTPSVGSGTSILSQSAPFGDFTPNRAPAFNVSSGTVKVMSFSSFGGVSYPSNNRLLILAEGFRPSGSSDMGNITPTSQVNQGSGLYEIISIAKYTGRPQLDVTAIQ